MDGFQFLLAVGCLSAIGGYITHILHERAVRQRAKLRHTQRLELEATRHCQRLELAEKIDTTMHVLVTDRELACTFDARLAEAMLKADIPRARVEIDDDEEEEEEEEQEVERSKPPRRKKKKS